MDDLLIACADVGSVANGNFGWADSDGAEGTKPSELAAAVAMALQAGRPVALGFECPLFIPLLADEGKLTKARPGEGNRPWSAGAGCGALVTGLVQATWILREIRSQCPSATAAFFDWDEFENAGDGLLIWEAFISGTAKALTHVADARLGVQAFAASLPKPQSHIHAENPISLAGFALMRAGWPVQPEALRRSCLAIAVRPPG